MAAEYVFCLFVLFIALVRMKSVALCIRPNTVQDGHMCEQL